MPFPFANPFGNSSGGYSIARSLRFNRADAAFLNRTPGASGNRQINTWSFWLKRGQMGNFQRIITFYTGNSDTACQEIAIGSNDNLYVIGWTTVWRQTTRVLRDPAEWYHIVVAQDTTTATANNRFRVYINGAEETVFTTLNNPAQNTSLGFATAGLHRIGIPGYASSDYFDGYLSDVYFVDGLALDPSYFGQTDATTGQWVPKRYTGSFGTTGCWLTFANNASTTTLGYDDAGGAAGAGAGSNDWTVNNISVTAGTGDDSVTDTPTSSYCTLSGLPGFSTNNTLTDGNLAHASASSVQWTYSTWTLTSGKWYWECTATTVSTYPAFGLWNVTAAYAGSYLGFNTSGVAIYANDGKVYYNAVGGSVLATYTNGDIISIAFDADTGKLYYAKNGTWLGSADPAAGTNPASTVATGGTWSPAICNYSVGSTKGYINFGQKAFTYTPPTGFNALSSANIPAPATKKPGTQFNTILWTGNGAGARSFTGVGFQPDMVWAKYRSTTGYTQIYDSVRGSGKKISPDGLAEISNPANGYLTTFDSDGFSTTPGATDNGWFNTNAATYVAWAWKKGATPGLDIVTATSTGTSGTLTIAHTLGTAPAFVVFKNRSINDAMYSWHQGLGASSGGYRIQLDGTAAVTTTAGIWGTGHTSSNVLVAQGSIASASGQNIMAMVFAEVSGFSRFGTYVGNASADGPFVWCGFRPRWILIKRATTAGNNWRILDTARTTYNRATANNNLYTNTNQAEDTTDGIADILSNGFKIRENLAAINASGDTYIFAAFAEYPFKYARAR